jgi:hypothetical protein
MTQDRIRQAFEIHARKHYGGPHFERDALGGYTSIPVSLMWITYRACAAEIGKDMSEIAKHLKRYVDFYGDIGEAREVLALADKWRG